ncbi:hypothetical protein [Streptomyces sp. SID10815]|uniref:hypothetical protein n=1 Tax=Streptomyces sp. SID10815 TaxID=2706027 RepID=UPI0013C5F11A|nr:hypothetical protein [Streptomyces sp. SID10815]NEA48774.1 hypothetical protein [Streptomyces sp. SID10815]
MYRHHIAPARGFTQFSNDLLRHPRLSSDAVRLLTWQLSLPQGARESLSRTAERARIGATAFTRAKRQLKEEGYVHERRVQGPGGLWVTQQLVSNVPLSAAEAAKLLGREPIGPAGPLDVVRTVRAAPVPACADSASPQLAPSPRKPAAGAPTPRPADGHPEKDPEGNTSHRPAEPRPEAEGLVAGARVLVAAFPQLSPDLRRVPRAMHGELVQLTTRWLAAGHTAGDIRTHILRGLPDDGTTVHRPGGLLRYLLREVPPVPTDHPPRLHRPPVARLAGLRECEGNHVQATLFRPLGDETLCPRCAERGRSTDTQDTSTRPPLPVTVSSG